MPRLPVQRLFGRVRSAALVIVAVAAAPSVCCAQAAAASTLKAAFTLNFVKFSEWPDLKPGLPISICVSSEDSIAEAMTEAMSGQSVGGRAIHVVRLASDGALGGCHLLFLNEGGPRPLAETLEVAGRLPILTISDVEQSAKHGAIVEFIQESGRLRFAINIDTMERSHIKLSSRLLSLAKIVRDSSTR
jgi:YfiR/HmsC-like